VYAAINIYTGFRLFWLFKFFLPSFRAFVFWPFYIVISNSYILLFLLRLGTIQFLRKSVMYSLPALVYLFMIILVLDGVRLVLWLVNRVPPSPFFSAAGLVIALILTVLTMIYGAFHARDIRPAYYEITLNKGHFGHLGQKLRVALISDMHIGTTVDRKWVAKIVDIVNKTEPDIICMAGDIFDNDLGSIRDLEGVAEELRRLRTSLGVYACQGNHDVDRFSLREGATTDRIHEFLEKAGVIFLQDEVLLVADRFYLAGRRDARPIGGRQERKTAADLVAGLDKSRPLIFLDHQPIDFSGEEETGVDLILSGHTHRGQFFPGNIATALIYKKAGSVHYGLWQGRSAQAVVSSGAGVWGPPIRLGTQSEVAVLNISFGE
jgi:predicted MPP superfamily phosphohydrolase